MHNTLNIFFFCATLLCLSVADTDQQKRVLLHGNDDIAAAVQLLTTTVNQLTTEVNHLITEVNQLTTQNKQLTSQNNQLTTQINHLNNDSTNLKQQMVAKNAELESKITVLESKNGQPGGGNVYIRWGRTTCPTNGTDLVYTGYAAGNLYTENGAADNLCLTSEPIWGAYDDTAQSYSAKVYGTEYEFYLYTNGGAQFFGKNLQDHDAPCAVCHTSRRATVMIPGRNQCYPGWTKEYSGYLVSGLSGYPGSLSPSNYACMDSDAEFESADYENKNGKLMYLVEAICGSLRCPPYVNYRELTCVVCSK